MDIQDFTGAIAERFSVNCGVVSSVVEDYLFMKIDQDQFQDQLRNLILQRSQVGAGSPLESF